MTKKIESRVRIWTHNERSMSARAISQGLTKRMEKGGWGDGARRIRHEGSNFNARKADILINWGDSSLNEKYLNANVINHPANVALATNKRTFFNRIRECGHGDQIPEFSASGVNEEVLSWARKGRASGDPDYPFALVRNKLTGSSGEGIELLTNGNKDRVDTTGKLIVRYIPKKSEWRIHIADNAVFHIQKKVLKVDRDANVEPNWFVRNHDNGFVFANGAEFVDEVPAAVVEAARTVISDCGLDFGAVDVVYNRQQSRAYAIEINTAPGMEGTTMDRYCEAFWSAYVNRK